MPNWPFRRCVAPVIVGAASAVAGCGDGPQDAEPGGQVSGATIHDEEYGVYDADELNELEDPSYLGRTVTVSANVNRIIEPGKAFLTGDDVLDENLLVIIPPQLKEVPVLAVGDDVLVVGKVLEFVSTDADSTEPFELDHSRYGEYDDTNAVLARVIIKSAGVPPPAP